jgi:hypothetical protein
VKLRKSMYLRNPFSLAFHHEDSCDSPGQFIFLAYTFPRDAQRGLRRLFARHPFFHGISLISKPSLTPSSP